MSVGGATEALTQDEEVLSQTERVDAVDLRTGGMAHEFNNLLSILYSSLEVVSKEVQSPAGVKALERMRRAISLGSGLTQQLFSLAPQRPLRGEKHDPSPMVASLESVLQMPLIDNDALTSVEENAGAEKALVVDDKPDVLNTMAEKMRMLGYEVLSATNGAEALEILSREPDISVLLSDVVMAGVDGVALGCEARKLIPKVKVILASGYPREELEAKHSDLADFRFLMKPFHTEDVARLLRRGH